MTGIFWTAGILCLVYYIGIIMYAGITADFAWIWILGAAAFCGCGLLGRCVRNHPEAGMLWVYRGILFLLTIGLLLFSVICAQVVSGMYGGEEKNLEYVVVLGAQVKGEKPSRALKKRLDKALSYGKSNQGTRFILSGGQGSGEDITEAQCMKRYLMEHGLEEGRLILEERSTNTKENLIFSNKLTGCAGMRTGILSNNFHVCRALKLARKQEYRDPIGIPAASDPGMQPHYVVREVFALVKEKLSGNI